MLVTRKKGVSNRRHLPERSSTILRGLPEETIVRETLCLIILDSDDQWSGVQNQSGRELEELSSPNVCTRRLRRLNAHPTLFLHPPQVPTMASSQQSKGRDGALSALDVLIQALNLAKDTCGIPPAQVALGSASVLLTMIRVHFPLIPRRLTSDSLLSRTRWPTIRTTSTLAGLAATSAKYSTGN